MDEERLTPKELKGRIAERAHELGFQLVGVTTPDEPPHLDIYEAWLDHGRHGEMAYMATDRARRARADPREILPECRSILVVGMNYLPAEDGAARGKTDARVSAYALGDDYHDLIPMRLEKLVRHIEEWHGKLLPHRVYADTGPILERELAQRAGLGWIGKNTCLIHPKKGSYFFLAEVFLGLDLPPDEPMRTDHCGSCARCLEACPTSCILPNRTLDATRCISYLTIELRGEIPADQRPHVGDWMFGCDICQQVCPWNQRFADPSEEKAFRPREILADAQPEAVLGLTEEDYKQFLGGSPLERAKRHGLVRNAAVVAGNRQDPRSVPALRHALLEDPHPVARQHAAWALGRIGGRKALKALRAGQVAEPDPTVQQEIRLAIGKLGA